MSAFEWVISVVVTLCVNILIAASVFVLVFGICIMPILDEPVLVIIVGPIAFIAAAIAASYIFNRLLVP